ncbi:unnamed protein product, partial [Rhizophagus irregularis]
MFGFNPREPFLFRTIRGIFIVSDLIISTYETSNIPDFSLCYADLTQFSPATSNNITTDI